MMPVIPARSVVVFATVVILLCTGCLLAMATRDDRLAVAFATAAAAIYGAIVAWGGV